MKFTLGITFESDEVLADRWYALCSTDEATCADVYARCTANCAPSEENGTAAVCEDLSADQLGVFGISALTCYDAVLSHISTGSCLDDYSLSPSAPPGLLPGTMLCHICCGTCSMVGQRCRNQNLAPVPTLSLCQGACVARLLYLPLPGLTGGLLEYGHEDAVAAARSEYEECVRCGNEGTAFFGGPCFWKQGAAPPEGRCTSHHCGICLEAHGGICRPSPAACTSLLDVEVFGDNFDASFGPSNMPVVQRNFNLLYRANRDLGLLIFDECKVECAEPACGTHVRKVGNGQVITNQEITCEDADETALAALGIDTSEFTSWKSSQGGCQGALFAMNQVGKTCSDDMSFFCSPPAGDKALRYLLLLLRERWAEMRDARRPALRARLREQLPARLPQPLQRDSASSGVLGDRR